MDRPADRLTKADWIRHGLRTLTASGPNALKVVPMASRLNVSRGSFYWHFVDIADFRAAVLQAWQARATDAVIQRIEAEAAPERLKQLMRRAFGGPRKLDRAIRAWAADDKDVAAVVAAGDAKRIAYIAKLLVAAGVERQRAQRRATFLYWAYLGQAMMLDATHAAAQASTLDDISALLES